MKHFSETHKDWDNVHLLPPDIRGPPKTCTLSSGMNSLFSYMLHLGQVVGSI